MIDSVNATARYVRLTVTGCANSSDQLMGINDFRIYSDDITPIRPSITEPHHMTLSVKPVANGLIIGVPAQYASGDVAVMRVTLTTPLGRTIYGKGVSIPLNDKNGTATAPAAGLYIVSVTLLDRQGKIVANIQQHAVLIR